MLGRLQAQLVAAGIALLTIIGTGLYISHLREKAERLEQVERDFAEFRASVEKVAAIQDAALRGYRDELETLRTGRREPVPDVRLCSPADEAMRSGEHPGSHR